VTVTIVCDVTADILEPPESQRSQRLSEVIAPTLDARRPSSECLGVSSADLGIVACRSESSQHDQLVSSYKLDVS